MLFDPRAAQERLLEDVLFTLVKNKEVFSMDKLRLLFPLLKECLKLESYKQ